MCVVWVAWVSAKHYGFFHGIFKSWFFSEVCVRAFLHRVVGGFQVFLMVVMGRLLRGFLV